MKELLQISKALADETRLRIINILMLRAFCLCELQKVLVMSEPRISRHLKILKLSGLLESRKDGKWIYFSLNKSAENDLLLTYLESMFKGDNIFMEDREAGTKVKPACSVQ